VALYHDIVILTGAGLSAESGIATFRDKSGVWAKYDWRQVATPEGFSENPDLVHEFYNRRRADHAAAAPNAAHRALARLEREHPGNVLVVTQNVDALHEAAGTTNLIHMHGELLKAWCLACERRHPWTAPLSFATACPSCRATGHMRPDIVWFDEMPYHMERIGRALADCDLFVSIGTSGNVYPAAGFVAEAAEAGAHTVELNLEPSEGRQLFDEAHHGLATDIVPAFVERLLAHNLQTGSRR
jgi:NAD-dependent deacetylase